MNLLHLANDRGQGVWRLTINSGNQPANPSSGDALGIPHR